MITKKDFNYFTCNIQQEYLSKIKLPIKAKTLLDLILNDSRISLEIKQFIYLQINIKHKKEFDIRTLNRYKYIWDWFDTGETIYNCKNIVESDNVFKSNYISFSNYIYKCSDCKNCLFCNNLYNKQFMAFNKQVTPARFKELYAMSLTELRKQPEFDARLYKLLRTIRKKIRKGESHNESKNDK